MDKALLSLSRCREHSPTCSSERDFRFRTCFVRNSVGRRACDRAYRSMGLQGCPSKLHATCLWVSQKRRHRVQCSPGKSDRVSSSGEISNASGDASGSNGNKVGFFCILQCIELGSEAVRLIILILPCTDY